MKYFQYFVLAIFIFTSYNVIEVNAQLVQSRVQAISKQGKDLELYAYYDLRERSSYLQITRNDTCQERVCIHVQIYQQDKGCTELNFEDELTPNDTVVYDLDNIIRNNGSPVPINLDDDSYGIVTISKYLCGNRGVDSCGDGALLGNFRIVDAAGYEYRMNVFSESNEETLLDSEDITPSPARGNFIIPFNTVDGAKYADIVAFVTDEERSSSGEDDGDFEDVIYNEKTGITFDIFQIDEDEERLSCDKKTFGCGPNVVLNYGINEDFPNSKGGPLLCEGAGLLPDQQHGYISLENAFMLSPLDQQNPPENDDFEFVCLYGLNNGDGTGSMDGCIFKDLDE